MSERNALWTRREAIAALAGTATTTALAGCTGGGDERGPASDGDGDGAGGVGDDGAGEDATSAAEADSTETATASDDANAGDATTDGADAADGEDGSDGGGLRSSDGPEARFDVEFDGSGTATVTHTSGDALDGSRLFLVNHDAETTVRWGEGTVNAGDSETIEGDEGDAIDVVYETESGDRVILTSTGAPPTDGK